MTDLNREVRRVSAGIVREAGKERSVIVTLKPPNLIGFRAKGCRKTYWLTTEACYTAAVKADLADMQRQKKRRAKVRRGRRQ